MLCPSNDLAAYLYAKAVDMRKSMNGLSIIVEQEITLSLNMAALFIFYNRSRDKIKILCWQRNGFTVWHKGLEQQRFKWSSINEPL